MTIVRHWRLAVSGLLTVSVLVGVAADGEYGLVALLLTVAAVSWPCLAGRVTWPGPMPSRLTRLTRRCWDEWQRRDWASMTTRMAPDIVMEDVAEGRSYRGPAEVRARLERFVESFPDGRIEVLGIDESTNRTTSQLAFWGTNTGPLDGRPPTDRRVVGRFCEVFTFRGGQIVRVEEYYDRHELLRQVGLAVEPTRTEPARQPRATMGLDSPTRDACSVRSAFRLLTLPGLSFVAQGNLVAAMVGLDAAKTSWTVARIVVLRALMSSGRLTSQSRALRG